jgi:rod shape-determining protein MreC
MSIYRPSSRRRVLLVVLMLASVSVITLDFRSSGGLFGSARGAMGSVLSPARRASSAVIHPVTAFFSGLAHSSAARDESQRLRAENAALRERLDTATGGQAQIDSLIKLNKIDLPRDVPVVGARVFAPAAGSFEWTVEIDVGSDKGVAVGNPVVSGDGLVGKVKAVRAASAVVLLVTDPSFSAGARLEESHEVGVVGGHGHGLLSLDYVDAQVPIKRGERVFTQGGPSSGFPAGIPIGTVHEAVKPDASRQRTIPVDPLIQARRLEFVKVLRYS